jgi:hypothetical protein
MIMLSTGKYLASIILHQFLDRSELYKMLINVPRCMKWSKRLANTDPATGNGLNVCFGRRSGFGGYDKRFAKGARKIVIREDDVDTRVVQTWIRLEDGNISGSITLNSTYGEDEYPAAPGQNDVSSR